MGTYSDKKMISRKWFLISQLLQRVIRFGAMKVKRR